MVIWTQNVLKSQINIKSDLGKIEKGNPKLRSEDQIYVIHRQWLRILTPKQMIQRLPISTSTSKSR